MKENEIKLGGSVDNDRAKQTRALFLKYYDNNIAVISLEQQGNYGKTVHVSAKADLSGMNKRTLRFYSYDGATGKFIFTKPQPRFWIDEKGFLNFDTFFAGDIVVTDRQLKRKIN